MKLFDFLSDIDNYEDRKVDSYKKDDLFVDTCRVSDSTKPFETAVSHPAFNDNNLIIVELYDTEEAAKEGHLRWIDKMLNNPPLQLIDVSTAGAASLLRALGGLPAYERNPAL